MYDPFVFSTHPSLLDLLHFACVSIDSMIWQPIKQYSSFVCVLSSLFQHDWTRTANAFAMLLLQDPPSSVSNLVKEIMLGISISYRHLFEDDVPQYKRGRNNKLFSATDKLVSMSSTGWHVVVVDADMAVDVTESKLLLFLIPAATVVAITLYWITTLFAVIVGGRWPGIRKQKGA